MILTFPKLQLIKSGTLYAKGDMTSEQMELCHDILQSYRKELEKDTKKEKPVSSLIEKLHEIQTTESYVVASTIQSYPLEEDLDQNIRSQVLCRILEAETTEILDPEYWEERERQIKEDYSLEICLQDEQNKREEWERKCQEDEQLARLIAEEDAEKFLTCWCVEICECDIAISMVVSESADA